MTTPTHTAPAKATSPIRLVLVDDHRMFRSGVKAELVVHYEKREPGPAPDGSTIDEPWFEARYDFVLQKQAQPVTR